MSYFLPEGYIERLHAPQSYDIGGDDLWQDEVYKTALALSSAFGLTEIMDLGCGSGFKLMKYFSGRPFHTTGIDLEPALIRLRQTYPGRKWCTLEDGYPFDRPDLLICSDVLEHVDNPDALLERLKIFLPRWLVISTPDRKLMERYPKWGVKMGPPGNGCHVREWAFDEFRSYMDQHFEVLRHFHSNREQCTQCIIARLKS
jgi:SAM-dependent methyltransferase